MEVTTNRVYPSYLQIEYAGIGNEQLVYIYEDTLIENSVSKFNLIKDRYVKIEEAFPEMLKQVKENCETQEQITEVKDWFFQNLDAILKPLSY
jgi:hypothetical protein